MLLPAARLLLLAAECLLSAAFAAFANILQLANLPAPPLPVRSLKPDYADAHCDLGCTYCAQVGSLQEAARGLWGCSGAPAVARRCAFAGLRSVPAFCCNVITVMTCVWQPIPRVVMPLFDCFQGDVENAKKCFKNAIKCAPQHLEVRQGWGQVGAEGMWIGSTGSSHGLCAERQ